MIALQEDSLVAYDDSNYLVDISCSDCERFDPMTDADLWRAFDILSEMKAMGVGRTAFEKIEKSQGVGFNAEGLLADRELRDLAPPSTYARDPMHTMLANGVVNVEIFAYLRALAKAFPAFSYKTLQEFCKADWKSPKARLKSNIASVFSDARESASLKDHTFKAGASEVLTVLPLLRRFVEVIVAPSGCLPAETASFLSVCKVVDAMQAAKRDGPQQRMGPMRNEIATAFRLHKAA